MSRSTLERVVAFLFYLLVALRPFRCIFSSPSLLISGSALIRTLRTITAYDFDGCRGLIE